jgi:hypothetical protein
MNQVWKPISERTPEEHRQRATRYREMAAKAATEAIREAFLMLAERYEGLAGST